MASNNLQSAVYLMLVSVTHKYLNLDSPLSEMCTQLLISLLSRLQIYSLDKPQALAIYYDPAKAAERSYEMERMAEQLATLCSTLGEYPSIRYRA